MNCGMLLTVWIFLAPQGFSDKLVMKNGETINGFYEGGTARVINFRTENGLEEFDLFSIAWIEFDADSSSRGTKRLEVDSRTMKAGDNKRMEGVSRQQSDVYLRLKTEASMPMSERAANLSLTVPVGSNILVRMIDSIDSERDRPGQTFTATLANPILVDDVEIVARGSDLRGRLTAVKSAGRIEGAAELSLELTQIVVNGIPYAMTTAQYEEVGTARGKETTNRMAKAAGVGALIGLIAGGGKGAAIGAGVSASAAGVAQAVTKGEQLYIPAETLLEFSISEPLVIAVQ